VIFNFRKSFLCSNVIALVNSHLKTKMILQLICHVISLYTILLMQLDNWDCN